MPTEYIILYEELFWKYCKNICLFIGGWGGIDHKLPISQKESVWTNFNLL